MITHDDTLRDRLAQNLSAHDVRAIPHGTEKRASVVIVVVPSEAGTDRTEVVNETEASVISPPATSPSAPGSSSGTSATGRYLPSAPSLEDLL